MENHRQRLLELLQSRAVKYGDVTLSSGAASNFYIDGKMVEVCPEGAFLIGEVLHQHTKDIEFDAIGGLAVGAVPMITSFVISCYHHGRDVEGFFVREQAKSHGSKKVLEGCIPSDARVVIVDDVVTSGKSVEKAIEAAEGAGATVVLILAIVDRQAGAKESFSKKNYRYESVFTKDELVVHANAE